MRVPVGTDRVPPADRLPRFAQSGPVVRGDSINPSLQSLHKRRRAPGESARGTHARVMVYVVTMNSIYQQPIPTRDERAEQLCKSERTAEWDRVRDLLITVVGCFAWLAVGLFLLGSAFHSTSQTWAPIMFWAGLVAGNAGILVTVALAFQRGQERGDW